MIKKTYLNIVGIKNYHYFKINYFKWKTLTVLAENWRKDFWFLSPFVNIESNWKKMKKTNRAKW